MKIRKNDAEKINARIKDLGESADRLADAVNRYLSIHDFDEEYYEHCKILRIHPNSTTKQVKTAFRKLVLTYHPDKNNKHDDGSQFKKIVRSYEMICKKQEI